MERNMGTMILGSKVIFSFRTHNPYMIPRKPSKVTFIAPPKLTKRTLNITPKNPKTPDPKPLSP